MSKAVLISIRPNWCELIASGKKTIEVRKTCPKLKTPFKCYIYMTKSHNRVLEEAADGNFVEKYYAMAGKIIGEFVCDRIINVDCDSVAPFDKDLELYIDEQCCLTREQLFKYTNGKCAYGLHISMLKIYDKPKELSEFYKKCETMRCEGCEHLKWQRINSDEYEYECEYLERIPIIRPPQSWCYVEEIE